MVVEDDLFTKRMAERGRAAKYGVSHLEAQTVQEAIDFLPVDYDTLEKMTREFARYGDISDTALQRDVEFRSRMYRKLKEEGYDLKSLVLKS